MHGWTPLYIPRGRYRAIAAVPPPGSLAVALLPSLCRTIALTPSQGSIPTAHRWLLTHLWTIFFLQWARRHRAAAFSNVTSRWYCLLFRQNRRPEMWPCHELNCYPGIPNFPPFCSTIARFPDNWGFWFLHRVQWWICNFREEFIKNHTLKISKIPNVFLWGPLGGKFRTSWEIFGCDL